MAKRNRQPTPPHLSDVRRLRLTRYTNRVPRVEISRSASPTTTTTRHVAGLGNIGLPREVLGAIARHLVDDKFSSGGLRSLAHLASASRAWHVIANPLLHELAVQSDIHHFSPSYQDPWKKTSRPKDQDAILISAVQQGNLPLLRRLVSHLPSSESSASLFTRNFLISWGCMHNHHHLLYQTTGVPRATMLHAAAALGRDEVVKWILCHQGVTVDCIAYLWCLCPSTHMSLIPWGCGPEPGMRATPLYLALSHGIESTARVLIEYGAVWDRPLPLGRGITGLHLMACNGLSHLIHWIADSKAHSQSQTKNIDQQQEQHQHQRPHGSGSGGGGREHDWPDNGGRSALHFAAFAPATRTGKHGDDLSAAAQLVDGLMRLGALCNTKDRAAIARRIVAEKQRLMQDPPCGDEGSEGRQDDGDSDKSDWRWRWSLVIRRGQELIEELWVLRPLPVEYALYCGNGAVAVAIAASAARQSSRDATN
ncbi:hypothetical protein CSUB01_08555 [Colletotrichum sublineola]|uniref:Uncharacterized protein n=1 Tax=Colletotrichum sublineola TaxID=1173701 RepID=A0A066X2V1_COLSU|nr:hypothetical protein CSUB01_08555 [Colletotrichum sublineola]